MRITFRRFAVAAYVVLVSAFAGCGESEKLYQVSGTVTYQGQPVPKGLIFFDPDPTKGTEGMQGFANILEGKYSTAENGRGIRGGAYEVRVNGFNGVEANEAPFGQALFPEYRGRKEFPAQDTTYDLEVPKQQ